MGSDAPIHAVDENPRLTSGRPSGRNNSMAHHAPDIKTSSNIIIIRIKHGTTQNHRRAGQLRLNGDIRVGGTKNAALPIMCATLLTGDPVQLRNVPNLRDIRTTMKLLRELGVDVSPLEHDKITVHAYGSISTKATYDLVQTMRLNFWC